jgi:hypothetical protein
MHTLLIILAVIAAGIFAIGLLVVALIVYLLFADYRLYKQLKDEGFFD